MEKQFSEEDLFYMQQALKLAEQAAEEDEVPVGAVVVSDGRLVGRGYNQREQGKDATLHAEMSAIRQACATLGGWRIPRATLYVTLEPCPMCAGAIINSRISTVCYGAKDEKAGCCGSVLNLFEERFNHKPRIYGGVLEEACSADLTKFFHNLRGKCGKNSEI